MSVFEGAKEIVDRLLVNLDAADPMTVFVQRMQEMQQYVVEQYGESSLQYEQLLIQLKLVMLTLTTLLSGGRGIQYEEIGTLLERMKETMLKGWLFSPGWPSATGSYLRNFTSPEEVRQFEQFVGQLTEKVRVETVPAGSQTVAVSRNEFEMIFGVTSEYIQSQQGA